MLGWAFLGTEGLLNQLSIWRRINRNPADHPEHQFGGLYRHRLYLLPFMILPIYASLEKLRQSLLLEAAKTLAVHACARSGWITMPLSKTASLRAVFWCSFPRLVNLLSRHCLEAHKPDDRQSLMGRVFLKSRLARGLGRGDDPAAYFNHPDIAVSTQRAETARG